MFSSSHVFLPAAGTGWEVWRCGTRSVWQGSSVDPAGEEPNRGRSIVALPARYCRTFAFAAPTGDAALGRKLAFAQLEKQGLTSAGADQTPFDCRVLQRTREGSVISVDILTPEAAARFSSLRAAGMVAAARLFPLPADRLVVMEEQGRLVLCAGSGGRLLHSQIISTTPGPGSRTAAEIRIATLALQQQGVLGEIRGIELWGDFPAPEAAELSRELNLPVEIKARPAPDPAAVRREPGVRLLPPSARITLRRRRLGLLRWGLPAALAAAAVWFVYSGRQSVLTLEAEAARLQAALESPERAAGDPAAQDRIREESALVLAAQKRWAALRAALDPGRYPVAHLDALSRCQKGAGVVLTRFESKIAEISVSGTAGSAMEAYHYFSTVSKDPPLGLYAWSMVQPAITADGTATFEMKGKMK